VLLAFVFVASACGGSGRGRPAARLDALWQRDGVYTLDLLRARAEGALPAPRAVTLWDPVYKARKSFKGYALAELIASLPVPARSLAGWQLVFECADGYRAKLPLDSAFDDAGTLAFADESAAVSGWQPLKQGKQWLTPDPFYLVWAEDAGKSRPWPYAILRLVVEPSAPARSGAAAGASAGASGPAGSSASGDAVERGRGIFAAECSKCHSINLHGGTLGPELNVPKNVTEYWQDGQIERFIANPASFRAGSKMPAFERQLGPDGIADVVRYLKAMREQKAAPAAAEPTSGSGTGTSRE
jgi:mono/diheme cytochrome c family protein